MVLQPEILIYSNSHNVHVGNHNMEIKFIKANSEI